MFPYWCGGIVYAPWDVGLRELWEENIRRTADLLKPGEAGHEGVAASDQVGLATAAEMIRRRGIEVVRVPQADHAHWLHLYRRDPPLDEIRLFHAFKFARRFGANQPIGKAITSYRNLLAAGICRESLRQDIRRLRLGTAANSLPSALADTIRLTRFLERLHRKWIAPLG